MKSSSDVDESKHKDLAFSVRRIEDSLHWTRPLFLSQGTTGRMNHELSTLGNNQLSPSPDAGQIAVSIGRRDLSLVVETGMICDRVGEGSVRLAGRALVVSADVDLLQAYRDWSRGEETEDNDKKPIPERLKTLTTTQQAPSINQRYIFSCL